MDRVEQFLGDRLRGRPVPDDLRRLVELQLDGVLADRRCPLPLHEVRVLEPGELHGLQQPLSNAEDDATVANEAAITEVLTHAAVVVDGFNGDLFGYWLHPDEMPTDRPAIVKLDTEGQFGIPAGSTLVEAMVFDWAFDDDISAIAAFCDEYGLPLATRAYAELHHPDVVVYPASLSESLYKRQLPFRTRPPWADRGPALTDASPAGDVPPIGGRVTDPSVRRLLDELGFTDSVTSLIESHDTGEGEVRFDAPSGAARLEFYQENQQSWWLYQLVYRRPALPLPTRLPTVLPMGFSADETRTAARQRCGDPELTALLVPVDRWRFGDLFVSVTYDDDDLPRHVRYWPTCVPLRSR